MHCGYPCENEQREANLLYLVCAVVYAGQLVLLVQLYCISLYFWMCRSALIGHFETEMLEKVVLRVERLDARLFEGRLGTQRSAVRLQRIYGGHLQSTQTCRSLEARVCLHTFLLGYSWAEKSPGRHSSSFTLSGCVRVTSLAVGQKTRSYQSPQLYSVRSSVCLIAVSGPLMMLCVLF